MARRLLCINILPNKFRIGRDREFRTSLPSEVMLGSADLHRLHERVCDGDANAKETITALLLGTCCRNLQHVCPRVDEAVLTESVECAVLSYLANPRLFNPSKGNLRAFIELAARRNVIDSRRADCARHRREAASAQELLGLGHDREMGPRKLLKTGNLDWLTWPS